jgi:hypothetical protein
MSIIIKFFNMEDSCSPITNVTIKDVLLNYQTLIKLQINLDQ